MELLLYKMHRLAQKAAVFDSCSDDIRQQWQMEMETLKAQIDQIVTDKLEHE